MPCVYNITIEIDLRRRRRRYNVTLKPESEKC